MQFGMKVEAAKGVEGKADIEVVNERSWRRLQRVEGGTHPANGAQCAAQRGTVGGDVT